VFLDNIVEYPVLQGRANPRHLESVQLDANSQSSAMQPGTPTSRDVPPRKASTEKPSDSAKAEAIANAKRTRGEYQAASEIKNTLHGADLRKKHSKTSVLATSVTECWE
jgi:hypothetical protein